MNFVFISPNFPRTYWNFCDRLKKNGVNVLGIGDAAYDTLEEPLKAGDVRVLRLRMNEDGSLGGGDNQEVGISVTLEWKDGGDHELEL